jgi:hypothetical protein
MQQHPRCGTHTRCSIKRHSSHARDLYGSSRNGRSVSKPGPKRKQATAGPAAMPAPSCLGDSVFGQTLLAAARRLSLGMNSLCTRVEAGRAGGQFVKFIRLRMAVGATALWWKADGRLSARTFSKPPSGDPTGYRNADANQQNDRGKRQLQHNQKAERWRL